LAGIDLSKLDLSHINFRQTNFTRACLQDSTLDYTLLQLVPVLAFTLLRTEREDPERQTEAERGRKKSQRERHGNRQRDREPER